MEGAKLDAVILPQPTRTSVNFSMTLLVTVTSSDLSPAPRELDVSHDNCKPVQWK